MVVWTLVESDNTLEQLALGVTRHKAVEASYSLENTGREMKMSWGIGVGRLP